MKVRELIRILEQDGWYWVRTHGSHHVYAHPEKTGILVVPGTRNLDVRTGTLNSILKSAGLKKD